MAQKRDSRGRFTKAPQTNGTPLTESFLRQEEFAMNALLARQQFIERSLDSRRDINKECGYQETDSIDIDDYAMLYDRESIATRVVEILPKESWKVFPTVYETEDKEEVTAFEEAWKNLPSQLAGQKSWYKDEEVVPIWSFLKRVDLLSGIGTFGVLFLGFDDGKNLDEPVEPREGMRLAYLRVMDESVISVVEEDMEPTSERFGFPTAYNIVFNDPEHAAVGTTATPDSQKHTKVHWTRVIHVADNLQNSEVYGIPRMQPVYNRLYDLRKLYGGSAEMYWMGAFMGLSFETHPQLGGDVEIDVTDVRSQITNFKDGLQRWLAIPGMTVKGISPQVVDPSKQIDVQIDAICIRLGIPKRIFMGSERGELASSQDKDTWAERVHERQVDHITNRIIVPFVNRLIEYRVLPEPVDGYQVSWPSLSELNPVDKAAIFAKRVEGIVKYVQGDGNMMISPVDLLTREAGYDLEEATAIVEAVLEQEPLDVEPLGGAPEPPVIPGEQGVGLPIGEEEEEVAVVTEGEEE